VNTRRTRYMALAGIVLYLAGIIVVLAAGAARADQWGPWNITDPGDVCVSTDFPVRGSGWPVHRAVDHWNTAQDTVTFRVGYGPGCTDVVMHRYSNPDHTACGYAEFTRLWGAAYVDNGVVMVTGADVWLNDACSPIRLMRKWVLAHELGHTVGMDHSVGPDSVLSESYDLLTYRGAPGPSDVATLAALYAR
jgi:hypothetical protein